MEIVVSDVRLYGGVYLDYTCFLKLKDLSHV